MADKNSGEKSVDNIQEQIRRLLEEKEELERRNREKQQLEQRLQRENVPASKSGSASGAGASASNRRSFSNSRESDRDFGELPADLSASVSESHQRYRSSQQSAHNSSADGAPSFLDDSRDESQRSSDDTEDDVMSAEHKQALRVNRDVLVENMTPDDIFNDLISKHILTTADVSRIKDKNTTEAINEELLNVLIKRSDRAFRVFVASLKRTLQGWLANRLEPGSQQKHKRKRGTGEVNVNLHCEQVVPLSRRKPVCSCQEVEEQVLIMAKAAFAHIRRKDGSSSSFEQFKKELKQTNEVLKESMEIVNTLKMLCRHGEITGMTEGSVCFTIRCTSLASCQALWEDYESGSLSQVFQQGMVTPSLLQTCRAKHVQLCLRISRLEYITCALELAYKEQALQSEQSKSVTTKRRARKRCIHNENMTGSRGCMSGHNKEQALQEISVNIIASAHSTRAKGLINRHEQCMSTSEVPSALPKKCKPVVGNLVTQHSSQQYTCVTEQCSSSNIWLRSYRRDIPICHGKHGHGQMFESCASYCGRASVQVVGEGNQNDVRTRQESYPYNLRYKLMNH